MQPQALQAAEYPKILNARAVAAGVITAQDVEAGRGFSGHSGRVGAAQDLTAAGIDLPEIMLAGGWRTPAMPARYSEKLATKRGGMAKLSKRQGR